MKRIQYSILSMFGLLICVFIGCAHLDPGADPIVVRAEQVESSAIAAFDLVVNVDNVNRPFWKTNTPPFHAFAEWLRAPQVFQVTNTVPRGSALVLSLHQVKIDYKSSRVSSNLLMTATATLLSAVNQANAWLTLTTNIVITPDVPKPTSWFWPTSKLQAAVDEKRMAPIRDEIHTRYLKAQLENP